MRCNALCYALCNAPKHHQAGDDCQLCLWAVEGLGESGDDAQAPRAPSPGAGAGAGAKRRKGGNEGGVQQQRDGGGGGRVRGTADAHRPAGVIVSQIGATVLPDKPNWVVQVGNTLCVADTGAVVRVYAVPQ